MIPGNIWRKCSSCKKDMLFSSKYYICSVSTCTGRVTNYAFCSVQCWDAHIPVERHRSGTAGALERTAPRTAEEAQVMEIGTGVRRIAPMSKSTSSAINRPTVNTSEDEILVVVSKVKAYITQKSGMNTSVGVFEVLSDRIRTLCDQAIHTATANGRKTVMDRDLT